jgi:hypothetical protein
VALAAAGLLVMPGRCSAIEFIKDVSREEAKKLGVVLQTSRNGEAGMRVSVEFEPKGELQNFLRVEVEIFKGGKCLIYAPLQTSNPTPGKIAAYFSTDASNFPWSALKIVVLDGTRTRIGYRLALKNFVEPDVAGPLTFALGSADAPLKRGAEGRAFVVRIGWPDAPGFAALATTAVPALVHPVAKFEFPHRDASRPPIELEVVLDHRC